MNEVHDRVWRSASMRECDGVSELNFFALGTRCRAAVAGVNRALEDAFYEALLTQVIRFESTYSRFLPDSLVSRINAGAGRNWVELDEEASQLLALCHELNFVTERTFDPTAGPLLKLWNWKANPPRIPSDKEVQEARRRVGWQLVERHAGAVRLPIEGMTLDLGGIGKEFAVDQAIGLAVNHGLRNVLIDFGQDIRVLGCPPGKPAWHVGLENPNAPGSCWASVAINQQALASSGNYLRCFEIEGRKYGHIIDPRTGYPATTDCLAASVVGPNCTIAGVLSTCALILGAKPGLDLVRRQYGFDAALYAAHGTVFSPAFNRHLVQIL